MKLFAKMLTGVARLGRGLVVLAFVANGYAQGTTQWTATFDTSPRIPPSNEYAISYYSEQGMVFTPIGTGQFGRSGGTPTNTGFPRNGTAYLFAALGYSLAATSGNGLPFGLVSVDLAEFSTLYPTPLAVQFVGYKPNGSVVTNVFLTDGVIDGAGPLNDFETFYFDALFADVVRVEVPYYGWSLDNMVFRNAPEPNAAGLVVLGGALFCYTRWQRKGRQPF